VTTAEIVEALRTEAKWYYDAAEASGNARFLRVADTLRRVAKRMARLADDDLADRVAKDCHDSEHDVRWCSTCAARADGIDAYRSTVSRDA